MSSHADTLHVHTMEQPDRLAKPFWTSVTLHVLLLLLLLLTAIVNKARLNMGSPTGGGMGSLLINPVATIPLPNRGGPKNPVANDTQSQVPSPPPTKEKVKPAPKVKAPPPDAIPLKSDRPQVKHQAERSQPAPDRSRDQRPVESQPNRARDQEKYDPNRLYSTNGQRASSPMYQIPGGGGVGIGDNSPFGDQFGPYANTIRDNIARNWHPTNAGRTGVPTVVITFTIQRSGAVTNVKIARSSGNNTLDYSAQRAVEEAQLPSLPINFPRNQADVEMKFELGN